MASMLRGFEKAILASRDYADHQGKSLLWSTTLSLLVDAPIFRQIADAQQYLSHDVCCFICREGCVLFTCNAHQVNLNIAVPVSVNAEFQLVIKSVQFIVQTLGERRVHIGPLETHLRTVKAPSLRFLSTKEHLKYVTYDAQRRVLCLSGREQPIERVLADRDEIRTMRPLTSAALGCGDETFWHLTRCNALVATRNSPVTSERAISFPPPLSCDSERVAHDMIHSVVRGLDPQNPMDTLRLIEAKWIPIDLRAVLVEVVEQHFGIRDSFIAVVSTQFFDTNISTECIDNILSMGRIMHLVMQTQRIAPCYLCEMWMQVLSEMAHRAAWRRWLVESDFVDTSFCILDVGGLRRLMKRFPIVHVAMQSILARRVGRWNDNDKAKAKLLVEHGALGTDGRRVRDEYQRLTACADAVHDSLVREETFGRHPRRKKTIMHPHPPSAPARREEDVKHKHADVERASSDDNDGDKLCTTSEARMARICALLGATVGCELIGSSLFYDRSDMDLVMTIKDAPTLEAAYARAEAVLTATLGAPWTRSSQKALGDRVVVLRGAFEGVPLDVQVWRGKAADTDAEKMTWRALQLSRLLTGSADAACVRRVRAMHVWADRMGVKGHTLCRLPGIAITCLAVVLPNRAALCDVLRSEVPIVDFDAQRVPSDVRSAAALPCTSALQVLVGGDNVATRLTRASTRHLLDLLSCDPPDADAWRRTHMVVAARLRPVDGATTIATSLHIAAARLDGHPFIEAVHFSMRHDHDDVLCVRVTLRADADVDKYGFRATDKVERHDAYTAVVTRGTRQWSLLLQPSAPPPPQNPVAPRTTVRDRVPIDVHATVPNAPTLTVDVISCFDSRLWTVA